MVQFLPLDPNDTETIDMILAQIDNAIQYHEDVEPRGDDDRDADDADGDGGDGGWKSWGGDINAGGED